ncbi:hypothetical protein HZH66_004111 [Vespula vulgaris]|uniref:Tetraspanin n=1 Tax=Vespula vulgaris TaxID=7454 RepID=A0A834KEN3_VESVU|nr:hypothetical protein HZH66_004111 [Vespula vulgaris]
MLLRGIAFAEVRRNSARRVFKGRDKGQNTSCEKEGNEFSNELTRQSTRRSLFLQSNDDLQKNHGVIPIVSMTGIVLLSLGLTIHAIYFNYVHFLDNKFLSIPSLMIAVGIIIFFIAFFGCCGAVRENYCMLIIFTTLLIFIFILEFSGGIAGYVLRSQAGEFECCGVTNMTDWEILFDNSDLPMSCCRPQQGKIGISVCNITVNYVYPDGCLSKFQQYIKSHAVQLGGVALGIATIQVIGIWFSIYLARSIRNSYESV